MASRYSSYKRPIPPGPFATPAYQTNTRVSAASQAIKCTISWDSAAQVYMVSAPYEPNFVEFIKLKIQPARDRAWDPNTKMWAIEPSWLDLIQSLATELWTASYVKVITRDEVEQAERAEKEAQRNAIVASLPERERAIYEFVTALPFEAIQAAYRKAATLLHPDRNPTDGEAMSKLNASWTRIEKEFGK